MIDISATATFGKFTGAFCPGEGDGITFLAFIPNFLLNIGIDCSATGVQSYQNWNQ